MGKKSDIGKEKLIFDILKAGLEKSSFPKVLEADWEFIEGEMNSQTVTALPAKAICESPIVPQKIKEQWKKIAYGHAVRWSQILYAQDELVNLMEQHQIPIVILKGIAAAMYYPMPEYRSMGDVDFLVWEKDYRKAFDLMKKNGYVLAEPEDSEDYHYALEKNGVVFELPRKLAKLPQDRGGKLLMECIHEGLSHRVWHQVDEYQIPVLPWLPNGLVLLYHIRQHLTNGLGLRQIIDWMMYVEKELSDERYLHFQKVISKAGLENLAIHVTRLCQKYLGLREEGITWCADAKEDLCEDLKEYILEQGNFGRKIKWEGKGAKAFSRGGIELLRWMQSQGRKHWKAVRKYPFLRHFAIFYELFRYIFYVLKKDKPIRSLLLDAKKGRRRKRMFKKLHT